VNLICVRDCLRIVGRYYEINFFLMNCLMTKVVRCYIGSKSGVNIRMGNGSSSKSQLR